MNNNDMTNYNDEITVKQLFVILIDYKNYLLSKYKKISIFVFFVSEMGSLVKIATILSFITAPLYAIINYLLVCGKQMPEKHKISLTMKIYSILGIIFLSFFSIWYITLL